MNPTLPPNVTIGGIARDYTATVSDLLRMAKQLAPEWTYMGDDDFGVVLLQLAAYLADQLHYRADTTLRDCLPTRSPHREVVREYAEWIGYLARRPVPAEVDVTLSLSAALDEDLLLPRGLQKSGSGPEGSATFELLDESAIPAGELSITLRMVEGELQEAASLGTATGRPGEIFVIPDADCIFNWGDDDLYVTVDGIEASHYRYPSLLEPVVLGYWVRLNSDGLLELRFGDGAAGRLLPPGADVRCEYRRGGGTRGNVGAGALNGTMGVAKRDGTLVTVTIRNAASATYGSPEESLASVRTLAPASFAAQGRAVTSDDYASHALQIAGVFRARVAAYGVNGVRIFVVPNGVSDGQVVTPALRARILRLMDSVKMCTDVVTVEAATLVPVDVVLNVRALRSYRNGVVRRAVRDQFLGRNIGLLWESRNDLGKSLWLSDMIGEVESVPGVNNFDVLRFCRRPQLRWQVFTGTAALSSTGVSINVTTRAQTWRIEMISSTQFLVTGSLSGLQPDVGEIGVTYSDLLNEISFKLEAGVLAMSEGDWAEIVVGELRGNILLSEGEFPIFDSQSVSIDVSGGIGG